VAISDDEPTFDTPIFLPLIWSTVVISAGGRLVEQLQAEGSEHVTLDIGRKSLRTLGQLGALRRVLPDALDLLLICVEAGMSVEVAFRKVSEEIGQLSLPLAEEFTLTMAELSFLADRRQAYDNLAKRTDVDGVKSVCMALQQAERYGTPLGTTRFATE